MAEKVLSKSRETTMLRQNKEIERVARRLTSFVHAYGIWDEARLEEGSGKTASSETNMNDQELRKGLIRLAYEKPELREDLLPLVAATRDSPGGRNPQSWLRSHPGKEELELLGRRLGELAKTAVKDREALRNFPTAYDIYDAYALLLGQSRGPLSRGDGEGWQAYKKLVLRDAKAKTLAHLAHSAFKQGG